MSLVLIQSRYAQTSPIQEYTNNQSTNVIVDHVIAHNADTSTRLVTMWIVPKGGTPDNSNCFLTVPVPAGQAYMCAELRGIDLGPGDSIYVQAASTGVISIRASGRSR